MRYRRRLHDIAVGVVQDGPVGATHRELMLMDEQQMQSHEHDKELGHDEDDLSMQVTGRQQYQQQQQEESDMEHPSAKKRKTGNATVARSDQPMATWVSRLAPAVQEVFGRGQFYALAQAAGRLLFL